MKASRKSVVLMLIAAATCALLVVLVPNWRWYRSAGGIESYLLTETPLGSSEDQVLAYLRSQDFNPAPTWRGVVEPNTIYPPNAVAGNSFIRATVGEYMMVFTTSVEAFYIFGPDRRLVEIAVRKSTESL